MYVDFHTHPRETSHLRIGMKFVLHEPLLYVDCSILGGSTFTCALCLVIVVFLSRKRGPFSRTAMHVSWDRSEWKRTCRYLQCIQCI